MILFRRAGAARWAILLSVGMPVTIAMCGSIAAQAPLDDGASLFRQRCQACHSYIAGQANKVGPNLSGVVGRRAASIDFRFSPALKSSGLTWTKANLDQFLAAPGKKVPGTRMVVALPDPAQRKALIDYLGNKQ